jgi:RimJ/RimL family protein N-acetyltransferase
VSRSRKAKPAVRAGAEAAVPGAFLSGRLVDLVPPEVEDAEPLCRWLNDPAVWVPFARLWPTNVEAERQWIGAQLSRRDELNFMVFERATKRPVGLAGLRNLDAANATARLGLLIGEASARGQGLGTEAAALLLGYGFDFLGLRRVNLSALAENAAAIRIYEKLGFRREGLERKAVLRNGEYVDTVHMGVFAEEFRARAGK